MVSQGKNGLTQSRKERQQRPPLFFKETYLLSFFASLREPPLPSAEVLKRAIALNPDPAEAYYALGLLHQHKGEWEPAAKAYRAAFESTVPGRTIKAPEPPSGGPPVAQTPAK